MTQPVGLTPIDTNAVASIRIGPGCWRRDLPARDGARIWLVDIEPGAEWPWTDQHDEFGEDVLVLTGSVIEGNDEYGAGTYLHFGPDSSHRPRSVTGATLFGINLTRRA